MITPATEILNQKGTPMFNSDLFANRPAAGIAGRIFISTDTKELYRDTGTTWELLSAGSGGTVTGTGSATQVAFWTGSSAIGGNNDLWWDNVNDYLGIKTNSPISELDVVGQGYFHPSITANSNAGWASSYAFTTATIPATSFSNLGNVFCGATGVNRMNYQGNATFAQANVPSAVIGNNIFSFNTSGLSITLDQGSGLRAFSALCGFNQIQSSFSGTISHLAGIHVLSPYASNQLMNVTNYYGLLINNATERTAFTITNRWGIYQDGALDTNYLNGSLLIKTNVNAGFAFDLNGTARFAGSVTGTGNLSNYSVTASSGLARSKAITSTLIAASNNDVLVGLDINPTFTNGAFTGVRNIGLRVEGITIGRGNGSIASNTAIGASALLNNTTGLLNTAIGQNVLISNTTGDSNTAIGGSALLNNTTGSRNVSIGQNSMLNNISGNQNIALGNWAGRNLSAGGGMTSATNSIFIGYDTRPNADNETNQIVIGNQSIGLGSNTTVLGNSSTTFTRLFGNVGLGTSTNAGFLLDVNGTARITTSVLSSQYQVSSAGSNYYGRGEIFSELQTTSTIATIANRGFAILNSNNGSTIDGLIITSGQIPSTSAQQNLFFNRLLGTIQIYQGSGSSFSTTSNLASCILSLESTTKGFLPPRMTTAQKNAIATPAVGLVVFDTTLNKLCVYTTTWETITSV